MANEPVNEDRYCPACGYNLRGLSGDPVRCPECFVQYPRNDLYYFSALDENALKRLQTWPTWCAGCVIASAAGLALVTIGAMPCGIVFLFPVLFLWPYAVYRFGKLCDFAGGWLGVLLWFHLVGLWFVVLFATGSAAWWLLTEKPATPVRVGLGVGLLVFFVVTLVAAKATEWSYANKHADYRTGAESESIPLYGIALYRLKRVCYRLILGAPSTKHDESEPAAGGRAGHDA